MALGGRSYGSLTTMLASIVLSLYLVGHCVLAVDSPLKKLVEGRCTEWKVENGITGVDCAKAWTDFEAIFRNPKVTSLCRMEPSFYDPLVNYLFNFQPGIKNPSLWSRVGQYAIDLCKSTGVCNVLETTLPGVMFNALNWCDQKLTRGAEYKTSCGCEGQANVVYAFWESVSAAYAQQLRGHLNIFLNGSMLEPFIANSTFGRVELPRLISSQTPSATVFMIHDINERGLRQGCATESMKHLKGIMASKTISFNCVEKAAFINHYQCSKNPDVENCQLCNAVPAEGKPILRLLLLAILQSIRYWM